MGKERQRAEPEKVRQMERNRDSRETEDERRRDPPRGEKVGGETHRGRQKDADREVDKRHLEHRVRERQRNGDPQRWRAKAEPLAPEVGHTDK